MNDISNSYKSACFQPSKNRQETHRVLLVQLEETDEKIEALQLFRSELLTKLACHNRQICTRAQTETESAQTAKTTSLNP